ncbi:hypothetical protein ACIRBX_34240 [Kitasatospora sp. NPDC096147]|uniref:hypothetical protein n=1 Tax=Kitasatospora sp. NPDC096147 TaxID=3364093 RepID=UPI00380F9E18
MALFRRRSGGDGSSDRSGWGFGRSARTKRVPTVDPTLGDPRLAELLRLAAAAEGAAGWAALRAELVTLEDQAELTRAIDLVAETEGLERTLAAALAADPADALALLVSGARQVKWAWEARSNSRAEYVSEDQWKVFGERLEKAEEQLLEVAEREPDRLAPWYFLQISGRGASLGHAVVRARFDAAVRRYPFHRASHSQQLQQNCRKWGGSHERMHAFARSSMLAAPVGSRLAELVVLAHLEHWLDLESGEDSRYLTSPQVVSELREAYERSLGHPDYRREPGWQAAHNTFAMAFAMVGEKFYARRLFEELDDAVTEFPWQYLDRDPVAAFTRLRDSCAR